MHIGFVQELPPTRDVEMWDSYLVGG